MAKNEARFKLDGTMASYDLGEGRVASVDLNAAFGFSGLNEIAQKALVFAVKTAGRNATAGKMDAEHIAEAFDAVKARFTAWAGGIWTAKRESDAEPAAGLLARALAKVMQCSDKDAADFIDSQVSAALTANSIDPEAPVEDLTDEQKKAKAKIAREVRKSISDDPAVALAKAQITAADAAAKLEKSAAANTGKESKFAGKVS